MDIYISKKCQHCKKLLVVFYNNKHLIPYFNIIDVQGVSVPNYIQSVPTLVYNGELYYDERMYNLIDSVNQHHIRNNDTPDQQTEKYADPGQNQNRTMVQQPTLPTNEQPTNLQSDPQPQISKKEEEDTNEIVGICMGEDCIYENINDETGNNNIMQQYCFLDDGYSDQKPKQESGGEKADRFDNNAYEELMKSRGNM